MKIFTALRHLVAVLMLCGGTSLAQTPVSTLASRYAPEAWQAQRIHGAVDVLSVGEGAERAYAFVPQEPLPARAPLVFFHHGWLGMNPKNFGGLIDLLVRRGAVVIFPVYQEGDETPPQHITQLAAHANANALALLDEKYPGLIDPARSVYVGFSMGAAISLNLALQPHAFGLPAPRALVLFAPGDAQHVAKGERARSILGHIENLPADLPVLIATGLSDTHIGLPTARQIAARLCHQPANKRLLLVLPSDENAGLRILAGHGSPGSPDSRYDFPDSHAAAPARIAGTHDFEASPSLNLLDYYAYWRLSTHILDWVNGASDYPYALFDPKNADNRFLGLWPSSTPYAPAQIETPCAP